MFKLLICDDESSIRNGLKCILDWQSLGFQFCGEAANGKDAVSQIIDLAPDLIMLDIKMPGLTGIEVMQKVKEHCKKTNKNFPSFLILSGFSDFEYAQKTINFGAKGYLLKPVDEDQLELKVKEIAEELKRNNIQNENNAEFNNLKNQNLLIKILEGENITTTDEFFENSEDSLYQVILLHPEYCHNFNKEIYLKSLNNYFSFFKYKIIEYKEKLVIVLKAHNTEAIIKCIERTSKLNIQNTFLTSGEAANGLAGIKKSYEEALNLEKKLFFINDKTYLSLSCLPDAQNSNLTPVQVSKIMENFVFCIETYDKKQLESKINEFVNTLQNNDTENTAKQEFIFCIMEVRNKLERKYPEREIDDGEGKNIVPVIMKCKTFRECTEYLTKVLFALLENFNFNTADSVIVKVIAYIKSNFSEDLKLENLGEQFNCNSAYLGKKFKKFTGVQFNTYLDNIRIEAAKEKLTNTDLKIYQISKLVGYANTDYFFMKFKKNTGLTPKEFKKQLGKNEED